MGRVLPNKEHKWIGSEAGLKVRKLKAQTVKVSNPTFTPALLQLKAGDGWPKWSWYPFFHSNREGCESATEKHPQQGRKSNLSNNMPCL